MTAPVLPSLLTAPPADAWQWQLRLKQTAPADALASLSQTLAPLLLDGDMLALVGGVGAGKTTLMRHLGEALKAPQRLTSPTFALLNQYTLPSGTLLLHGDCYRLAEAVESAESWFEELVEQQAMNATLTCLEWADVLPCVFHHCNKVLLISDAPELAGEEQRHYQLWQRGERRLVEAS